MNVDIFKLTLHAVHSYFHSATTCISRSSFISQAYVISPISWNEFVIRVITSHNQHKAQHDTPNLLIPHEIITKIACNVFQYTTYTSCI
jgi:hypothetical protein